jgi:hypothetical protein
LRKAQNEKKKCNVSAIETNFLVISDHDYFFVINTQVNNHTMVLEWREREHEDENNAAENHPATTCCPKKLWIA